MLLVINDSNTIIETNTGQFIYFGYNDFLEKIINGDNCFICGIASSKTVFNNEHVIPNWILKRFNLHGRRIKLPNSSFIKYSQYRIPCCKNCNSELGKHYESPIRNLLDNSYSQIVAKLSKDKELVKLLFVWMGLLFFKTHFKDTMLSANRDVRIQAGKIGDSIDWSSLHHIHCLIRRNLTNAIVHENVYGSLLVIPALSATGLPKFDYIDSTLGDSVLIRIGETYIIAVLTDASASRSLCEPLLNRITGPLTNFQIRELLAHVTYININMIERPSFYSTITEMGYEISVKLPRNIELLEQNKVTITLGQLLHYFVKDLYPGRLEDQEMLKNIKEGKVRFLFNEDNDFIQH